MKIGEQIRKLRSRKGISQLDLALAIGYKNQSDVSRIERDDQWPDGERLEAIANALGCKVSEIFAEAEYDQEGPEARRLIAAERIASYLESGADPTLDNALEAVSTELPPIDPRSEATLAVQVFSVAVGKQNADRIVAAIDRLTETIARSEEPAESFTKAKPFDALGAIREGLSESNKSAKR